MDHPVRCRRIPQAARDAPTTDRMKPTQRLWMIEGAIVGALSLIMFEHSGFNAVACKITAFATT